MSRFAVGEKVFVYSGMNRLPGVIKDVGNGDGAVLVRLTGKFHRDAAYFYNEKQLRRVRKRPSPQQEPPAGVWVLPDGELAVFNFSFTPLKMYRALSDHGAEYLGML